MASSPPGGVPITRELALLVNPTSAKGRAVRVVEPVTERLQHAGNNVRRLTGTDAADAARLAAGAVAEGVDALVALGGDGLVNIALQAVAGTGTPLGVIPAGTGNDVARSLGLPCRSPLDAAEVVAAGSIRRLDAVCVEGSVGARWFLGVLGAGFDSLVNERANRMRWPRGQQRYNVAVLAELRVFQPLPFTITLDDEVRATRAMLVAVGNGGSYGGGMRVCPDADMHDGLLDVTVVGPVSKPTFVRVFPKVFRGTHVHHPAVTTHRARRVTLDSPDVVAYADGERLGPLPVTCTAVPGAVTVITTAGT